MAEEKVELQDINFRHFFSWTELFRTFQVALDPKKLLLAAGGIFVMWLGWFILALVFYGSQAKPEWADGGSWKEFKEARQKWNRLHEAAGSGAEYTDAGDLANSPDEYKSIEENVKKAVENLQSSNEPTKTQVVDGNVVALKPAGVLRTAPWTETRGRNPYLLVTGQTDKPWAAGEFGDWLLSEQVPVLLEPLRKFLYPVIYLLHPNTGSWNRFYFLLVTLWTLATWALFGGAITRIASVQVCRNEKVGLMESLRFVKSRYVSYLSAPIFPLLFVLFIVVLLCIYGLFYLIPILGDIAVAGLFYPLVLMAGVAMAVVLVGLVGWPMMYATISAEGSDSFDAISRSYSYVYQSPWHYIWYAVVACAYGAVVVFFVGFMGSLVVYMGKWGFSLTPFSSMTDREPSFLYVYAPESFGWRSLLLDGATVDGQNIVQDGEIDPDAYNSYVDTMSWWNMIGTYLVSAWLYLVFLMVLGFGYSYFWSASTIIYLLMRRRVDDTDLDEVYMEEDDLDTTFAPSVPEPPPAPEGGPVMVESPTLRTPAAAEPPPEPAASEGGSPPESSAQESSATQEESPAQDNGEPPAPESSKEPPAPESSSEKEPAPESSSEPPATDGGGEEKKQDDDSPSNPT